MESILYYVSNVVAIGVLLGIAYLVWYGFRFKEYDILFGIGLLTVIPTSIFLINFYPVHAAVIIYVLWFFVNFSSHNKAKEGVEKEKLSLGNLAWESLKYTAVTLLIAFVISAIFSSGGGGGGGGGGSCSRASPQFC